MEEWKERQKRTIEAKIRSPDVERVAKWGTVVRRQESLPKALNRSAAEVKERQRQEKEKRKTFVSAFRIEISSHPDGSPATQPTFPLCPPSSPHSLNLSHPRELRVLFWKTGSVPCQMNILLDGHSHPSPSGSRPEFNQEFRGGFRHGVRDVVDDVASCC